MIWSNLGINVAADINFNGAAGWPSNAVGQAQVDSDLNYLITTRGIKKIRVSQCNYSDSAGLLQTRYVAQKAKSLGAYTIYGVFEQGSFANASKTAYETSLTTEATWAQSIGIDEFQSGNEWEINISGDFTEANIYTYVQTLPAKIKTAGFKGKISTSVSQNHYATWQSSGIGAFDLLGLNVYGASQSFADFQAQINSMVASFGSQLFLSEWGIDNNWPPTYQNGQTMLPEDMTTKLANYMEWLKANVTIPVYFFSWRFDGNGVRDQFAVKQYNNLLHPMWNALLRGRRQLNLQ